MTIRGTARGTPLHPKFTDVNYTLKFGREKIGRFFLGIGVLCLALGIYGVSYDNDRGRKPMSYFAFVLGLALTGYGIHRTFSAGGKPLLVLSPTGIALDIEFVKTFFIPWHEVRSVAKVNQRVSVRGVSRTNPNVTAVSVSKDFYDRHIHVSNPFLRGPGWGNAFVDYGDNVEIMLSEQVLSATADEIFAAVETRWKAFRDRKPPAAAKRTP